MVLHCTSVVIYINTRAHLVVLYMECTGNRIGKYYLKKNCYVNQGKCCASGNDGTGAVQISDESDDYCGFCFSGKPTFEGKEK